MHRVIIHLQIRCKCLKPLNENYFIITAAANRTQKVKGHALKSAVILRNVPSRARADLQQTTGSCIRICERRTFLRAETKAWHGPKTGVLKDGPQVSSQVRNLQRENSNITFVQTVLNRFSQSLMKTI